MGGKNSKGVSDEYVRVMVDNKLAEQMKKHKIDLEHLRTSMVSPEEADDKAQMAAIEAAYAAKDELEEKIGERLTEDEVSRLIKEANEISQMRLQADMAEKFNVVQKEIHDVQAQVRQHGDAMNIMWKQRYEDTTVIHQAIQSNTQALFKIMEIQNKDVVETTKRFEQLMLTQSEDRKDTNEKIMLLVKQQSKVLELVSKNNATISASGACGGPTPIPECPNCSTPCKLLFCQHYYCKSCHVRNGRTKCPVCDKNY